MKRTYRARHILVGAKYEAEDILRKLGDGADFADLARKFSTCSSAKNGGDLGQIPYGKAQEDFEAACLNLEAGETTKAPVRTPFGYHIINRIE